MVFNSKSIDAAEQKKLPKPSDYQLVSEYSSLTFTNSTLDSKNSYNHQTKSFCFPPLAKIFSVPSFIIF